MIKKSWCFLLSVVLLITANAGISFAAVPVNGFVDCQEHWAKDEINVLVEGGIITGRGRNRFYPDVNITRAEFLSMIARVVGLEDKPHVYSYSDVNSSLWYSGAVQAAHDCGLINPSMLSDNCFEGDKPITREEMASMVVAAYTFKNDSQPQEASLSQFTDCQKISEWAVGDVKKAAELGIITGVSETELQPHANATRAQAAVIIFRLTAYTGGNILPNGDFSYQDSSWQHQLRTGALRRNEHTNPSGRMGITFDEGHNRPGCFYLDIKNSGNGNEDSLRWNYNFVSEGKEYTIEKGKSYVLSFYAKLEGVDGFTITKLRLQDRIDNNLRYTADEAIKISGSDWKYYQMYMIPNDNAYDVRLQFQAGGDNISNFKLYLDDFRLEESTGKKKVPVSITCDEGLEEIAGLSGEGTYDEGTRVILSAGVKKGYNYLFETWIDGYENAASQNSVLKVTASDSKSFHAKFRPYKAENNNYAIAPSGDAPSAAVTGTERSEDAAVINCGVTVPVGYMASECGVVISEGAYAEGLNVFSQGARIIRADTVSEEGSFSVKAEGLTKDEKYIVRSYLICRDENDTTYVFYSDKDALLPVTQIDKKAYKLIYNHELLLPFAASATGIHDYDEHEIFISELEATDVDAVTICPQIWRTYLWDSKVDTSLREPVHPNVTSAQKDYEAAKQYILSGGDLVGNAIRACREFDRDALASFRMNDYHYTNDTGWPTHNYFWQEHPEYWLYDSGANYWQRLHNYMVPEVRDFYYDMIEEFLSLYDVDGVELDFMRSLMYFYPEDVNDYASDVMTDFVGRIRGLLDKVGKERGKYLQLILKVPEVPSKATKNGLDPLTWDKLGYADIIHLSFGDFNSTEIDVEYYKENLKNSKVYAELNYITYQTQPAQRFTKVQTLNATAYNLLSRGVDGLTTFNMGYYFKDKTAIINSLRGITDINHLAKTEKLYLMSRDRGTFPANTKKEYTLIIPDDVKSGIFSKALFRVEMEKDCTAETIEVYVNDIKLEEVAVSDTELFPVSKANATGYPTMEKLKFYKVPLNALKTDENKFYVNVVSDDNAGRIFSTELALYH